MLKKTFMITAVLLTLFAGTAYAEDWAQGFGKTPTEAIDNAFKAAEKIVKSVGKGCVGPGKEGGKAVRFVEEKNGMYQFEAVYSHHNGSCGKRKKVAEYVKELGF